MTSFDKLQEKMIEVEKECEHKGYYYKISDALTIMVCTIGMGSRKHALVARCPFFRG